MKSKEMKRLALMGIAVGILAANQQGFEAAEINSIDLDYVLAKPSCKAHGGCGGLTAYREVNNKDRQDQNKEDANSDEDQTEMNGTKPGLSEK